MPTFRTDQALWYNVGVWGQLGYAVPNFGDDTQSLNSTILKLTSVMGRNLSAIMHHADADLRTPPSINTLTRVHKLIVRARSILAGRAVPSGTPDFEAIHATPSQAEFILYPVPFFRVRNEWMKEWCGLTLNAISEAMQHTENRKEYEISEAFAGLVGAYLHRVYRLMATELFGASATDAAKRDFTLTDVQLAAYDPSKYFTATELIDTVPPLGLSPTEDDILMLTNGIPASQLLGLSKWPSGEPVGGPEGPAAAVPAPTAAATQAAVNVAFPPPPGP